MKGHDFILCLRFPQMRHPEETMHLSVLCRLLIMAEERFCILSLISAKAIARSEMMKRSRNEIGDSDLWLKLAAFSHGNTVSVSGVTGIPSVALLRTNEASS